MKNLYKTKKILAPFCSVLIIMLLTALLASCADVFNPSFNKESGLTVTVLSDSINQRTLYPSAEQFTKYELEFEGPGGAKHTETLTEGQKSVTVKDLAEGEWTITAIGYVLVKDPISDPEGTEYPAAEGTAAAVITDGINPNVNIKISAKREGENLANGYFVYSVDYPASKVDSAYIDIMDMENPYLSYGYKDLNQTPEGSIPLAPGFYLMQLRLANDYQAVSKTEVIHIYENMETVGDFTFTESDFADILKLTLTNDITFEGQEASYIQVYTESYNDYLGNLYKDSESGEWIELPLLSSYEGKPLIFNHYFEISGYSISKDIVAAPVRSGNKLSVDFGSQNFSMITFGGTVEFKINGVNVPIESLGLYADNYQAYIDSIYPDSDGNWSLTIPELESQTEVWIAIYYEDSNGYRYYQTGESITVYNESKTDFALSYELNDIIISGTVTATIDGVKPDRIEIEVSNYGDGSSYVGWIAAVPADEDGNWTVFLPEFAEPTVVSLAVLGYIDGDRINFPDEPIRRELYKADTGESGITLTASVGKVIRIGGTIDFQFPMSWGGVNVETEEGDYLGYAPIENGAWGVLIEPLETETTLRFRVDGYGNINGEYKNFSFINPKTETVKDRDITNIHLTVSDKIIMSGTVTAAIDGQTPDRIEIEVSNQGDGSSYVGWIASVPADEDGNWTVALPEFSEPTVVSFAVRGFVDNARINFPGDVRRELYKIDSSESGITLTANVGEVIRIGGTINFQFPISWAGVNVEIAEDNLGYSLIQDNTWVVLIEPLETETTLRFRVDGYGEINGEYKNFSFINPNQSVTVKDQDVTNINLTVSDPEGVGYRVTEPSSIQGGSIYVNKTYAKEGEKVTIEVYPNSGYRLKAGTLSATGAVVSRVAMDTGRYIFTMPASNVTVSGEFESLLPDPPTSAEIYLNNGATGAGEVYTISSGEPYKELVIVFDSSLQGSEVDFSWTGENLNITPTRTDLDITSQDTNYGNQGCNDAMYETPSAYPFTLTLLANSFKVSVGGMAGGGDHEISDIVIKINGEEIPITHTYENYPNLEIPLPN